MVYLERWERDGVVNIYEVDKINYIKPTSFSIEVTMEKLEMDPA